MSCSVTIDVGTFAIHISRKLAKLHQQIFPKRPPTDTIKELRTYFSAHRLDPETDKTARRGHEKLASLSLALVMDLARDICEEARRREQALTDWAPRQLAPTTTDDLKRRHARCKLACLDLMIMLRTTAEVYYELERRVNGSGGTAGILQPGAEAPVETACMSKTVVRFLPKKRPSDDSPPPYSQVLQARAEASELLRDERARLERLSTRRAAQAGDDWKRDDDRGIWTRWYYMRDSDYVPGCSIPSEAVMQGRAPARPPRGDSSM
ncbi:hypothetical protein LTR85_002278 [Meristemomyces frigidus]|nr:hypothetical protein LTR85_002278 [Meristemomyces frigidus]